MRNALDNTLLSVEVQIAEEILPIEKQRVVGALANFAVDACPSCGSRSCKSDDTEAPGFSETCGDREITQLPYVIRECLHCGLLYKNPTLCAADAEELYKQIDFRDWETDGLYPTERAVLGVLRELPPGKQILDFGCSSGRLLSKLVASQHCYGVELNSEAAAEAAGKGIKVVSVDSVTGHTGMQFDVVILVDVFEHLTAPLELLRKLFGGLRDGGMLIVVTGNGDFPLCRMNPGEFWYFRTTLHVCMLTKRHASFLAQELGAKIEHWQEVSHYDTPLLHKVWQWGRHFAYWQFRDNTLIARTTLPFVPLLCRARLWKIAPAMTYGRDHVMVLLRRT